MPTIDASTPRTTITIKGDSYSVPQPYTAGAVLNANEASALNQTYAENLRNNFGAKVAAAKEAGSFDLQVFQGNLDDYADEYEFGVRTGGGRSGDPVTTEALSITRELVRKALVKAGKKLADVPAAKITELAKAQLAKTDDAKTIQILETAKQRVAAAQDITDIDLSSTEVAEAETPAPKKAKAEAVAQA